MDKNKILACRNRKRGYTVDITDTGRTGDGVTRIGGLVVFVKNAKAGDTVSWWDFSVWLKICEYYQNLIFYNR